MYYTDRVYGYQIADPTYIGYPPKDTPPMFDIIRWVKTDPHEVNEAYRDKDGEWKFHKKISTEFCYVVGMVIWDSHEGDFKFESVGLRWLEENPPKQAVDMILKFCEENGKEMPGRYDD